MPNKSQLLQELKGERVTIYTVEKEFTGVLREFENEYSVCNVTSRSMEIITIDPVHIADIKRLSLRPVIFMYNHFNI